MKTNSFLTGVALCALAVSLTACDKAKDSMDKAKDAAGSAADSAKDAAGKAVDATKDMAGKAMDTAKDAATAAMTNAVAAAVGPGGEAIAAAKKALDEKNYSGALDALKKLEGTQLSPEVQKVVDELKAQATKMMGGGAADAVKDAAGAVLPK